MKRAVFVTRPAHQAADLAADVEQRGFMAVLAPVLAVELTPGAPFDLAGVAGIAVTSANGVAALARRTARRDIAVYAVGEATAAAARTAGFAKVEAAGGTAQALSVLIAARVTPGGGAILYPAGRDTAFDLTAALEPLGLKVLQVPAYDMPVAAALPPAALAALDRALPAYVLLMSARTALAFGDLAAAAGRAGALRHVTALCLSQAVAEAARGYGFAEVLTAADPTPAALLDLLEAQRPPA